MTLYAIHAIIENMKAETLKTIRDTLDALGELLYNLTTKARPLEYSGYVAHARMIDEAIKAVKTIDDDNRTVEAIKGIDSALKAMGVDVPNTAARLVLTSRRQAGKGEWTQIRTVDMVLPEEAASLVESGWVAKGVEVLDEKK